MTSRRKAKRARKRHPDCVPQCLPAYMDKRMGRKLERRRTDPFHASRWRWVAGKCLPVSKCYQRRICR